MESTPVPRAKDQVPYWERVAPDKEFTHPVDVQRLARYVGRDERILDLGCGYGRVAALLVDEGFRRVTGLDTSAAMVARGRRERPDLDLRAHGDLPLPFEDHGFDAALLFSTLTCVPAPDERHGLMQEVRRLLRPGGTAYVSDFLLQEDERNARRYAEGQRKYGRRGIFELPEGVVLCHFGSDELCSLTEGWDVLERIEQEVRTMNGHPARAFQLLLRRL